MYFVSWLLLVFLIGTLIGHILHWAMHKKWSGKLYRVHTAHHRLYKYNDYYSKKYRQTGKVSSTLYFVPIITAFVCAIIAFAPAAFIPWLVLEGIVIGAAHEFLHIAFHLDNMWLRKFKVFRFWEEMHREHHRKVHFNYGIFWFGWDRLFGSFKKVKARGQDRENLLR